jgi:hypothetical protein
MVTVHETFTWVKVSRVHMFLNTIWGILKHPLHHNGDMFVSMSSILSTTFIKQLFAFNMHLL